jgi:hypothetical protein
MSSPSQLLDQALEALQKAHDLAERVWTAKKDPAAQLLLRLWAATWVQKCHPLWVSQAQKKVTSLVQANQQLVAKSQQVV